MNALLLTVALAAPPQLHAAGCTETRFQAPWQATTCYMLATMDWWDHRPLYPESDWKPVKEVRWE